MPTVQPNESREHYMSRCVRVVMGEGLTQKQAVGKCEGMYDSARKKENKMKIIKEDDQDKIDAITATIADLNDQLDAAKYDADKQTELRDRIDAKKDQLDKLTKEESVMKIVKEGKGIKTIPASQARKDPEGRKVQRAQALAQGYDGVRYENEEGEEVFHEADDFSGASVDDMNILVKEIEPIIAKTIDNIAKVKIFGKSNVKDDARDMGNILGRAIMVAIIKRIPSQVHHQFILGIQDQL